MTIDGAVDSLPVPQLPSSPQYPQGLCLDKGYGFAELRCTLDDFGFTAHIRSRGEEALSLFRIYRPVNWEFSRIYPPDFQGH